MRDYALTQSAQRDASPGLPIISRLWRNFLARRALRRMEDFDEHMLRDIGVTRLDVEWAAGLPLTVNAAVALEERAFRQRRYSREKNLAL